MSADVTSTVPVSIMMAQPAAADEAAWEQETADLTAAGAARTEESETQDPWESALGQIESVLDEAEGLVAPGFLLEEAGVPQIALWVPPADLGPLPADLADRVRRIFDRQAGLAPRVEEAVRTARAHLRAVGSMRTNDTSGSVYLDAVG